jgi:hypothetical protein
LNTLIEPADIGPEFAPSFRDGVTNVAVKDEAVLYDEATGDLHQLDAIAALVCRFFDGFTSIRDAATELAEAFGEDREVIERDVLEMTRQLGQKGLLVGVQGDPVAQEDEDGC